jgi:hypothetical protein
MSEQLLVLHARYSISEIQGRNAEFPTPRQRKRDRNSSGLEEFKSTAGTLFPAVL